MTTPHHDPNDPIAQAWAAQDATISPDALDLDSAAFAESIDDAHRREQRRLVWLNVREVLPAFFSAAVFAVIAPTMQRPTAVFLAAGLYLFIGLYMLSNSIRHHRADQLWGGSIRDQLERRLNQLHHRVQLYRTSPAWYFFPGVAGMALVLLGAGVDEVNGSEVLFAAGFVVATIAVTGFGYLKAKKERRVYEEQIEELTPIFAEFS